jgi:dienelactone hydrolase
MAIATRTVTYNDQETALTGVLAWDDAAPGPLPGLLLVHGGAGLDDHAKGQARRYAGHGYAVLAVLTLARSGADLRGVVSIHGSLVTAMAAQPGLVKAKVLVCHGALDPHVPLADVTRFAEEMSHAQADWQLIMYGGAMHGFTHEHAVPGAIPGVAYDALADRRSFLAARTFLAEALNGTPAA